MEIHLLVRDVERSRRFYIQVLGMEEIPRPSTFDFPGAWLRKGSAILHLTEGIEPASADQIFPRTYTADDLARGRFNHFAFEVDDLEGAQHELEAHNVAILVGPRPRGDGVTELSISDPDGYLVELLVKQK